MSLPPPSPLPPARRARWPWVLAILGVLWVVGSVGSNDDDDRPRYRSRVDAVWPQFERDICLNYLDAIDAGLSRTVVIDAAVEALGMDVTAAERDRLATLIAECED